MSRIDKLYSKFLKKPIPNDITFHEIETLFKHMGCEVISGGNHMKVVHTESGTIIPISRHGKVVGEGYIKQLKELLTVIEQGGR